MDPQKELNLGPANYAIEPFRTENLSSLFELYRRVVVFPDAESITEYWQWRFGRNPFDDGTRPPFWVAKRDRNIVGALAQVPVILDVAGHPIRAYWAADFMVDPEVRGRGLGKQIFSRYRESNPMVLSMGYSPNSVTSRVARAVGFRSLHAFSRV